MLTLSELVRYSEEKPPKYKTVLFVWWHRNGIETSQKTLGFLNGEGNPVLDFIPCGNPEPTFWCNLFS